MALEAHADNSVIEAVPLWHLCFSSLFFFLSFVFVCDPSVQEQLSVSCLRCDACGNAYAGTFTSPGKALWN